MTAVKDENTVVRGMVIAVLSALTVIAVLAISTFYVLTAQIRQQAKYSNMLSLCARQRVLTQRAPLLGFSLMVAHDENLQSRLRGELLEIAGNIEQTNAALFEGEEDDSKSTAIRAFFSEAPIHLNDDIRRFTEEVNALASEEGPGLSIENPHLYYVASASTDVLRKLELLTEQYRYEGQYGVLQLQRYHQVILGVMLLTLAITALFIFKPMIERLRTELRQRAAVTRELELSSSALRERTEQLTKSNQELEQFASVVAHDLRAPLQNIILGVEILRNKIGSTGGADIADVISATRSAANRMDHLISGLLKYSRAAANISPLGPVSLSTVVDEVLEDLSGKINQEKAEVLHGELPTIRADRVQMHQLFQNLIENSLKYRHPERPPVITVNSSLMVLNGARHHQIIVKDNGIGFDASQADRMFRMFTRLDHSSSNDGLGIGLATCERIVRRHEGTIRAEGREGEGSTFTITLPEG